MRGRICAFLCVFCAFLRLFLNDLLLTDLLFNCRGDTRPARGSKLTLLARTVDGYHPSII